MDDEILSFIRERQKWFRESYEDKLPSKEFYEIYYFIEQWAYYAYKLGKE